MMRLVAACLVLCAAAGCAAPASADDEFRISRAAEYGDADYGVVQVRASPSDLSWHQLQIRITGCGLEPRPVVIRMGTVAPYVNQRATSAGVALNPPDEMCRYAGPFQFSTEAGQVRVGDWFQVCSTSDGQPGAHDTMFDVETANTHAKLASLGFPDPLHVCA